MRYCLAIFLCLIISNSIFAKEPKPIRPDEALYRLMNGNERYRNDQATCPDRHQERRAALVTKQKPFAVIIGCADSRVGPEIIFDQGAGNLFVVRIAGNVIGPMELDSIDYAIHHLRASLIVVLGHENCGAIQAVLAGETGDIESVAKEITRNLKMFKDKPDSLEQATKRNVQAIVAELESNSNYFRLILGNRLNIVGGYYHLSSGEVEILRKI